MAFPRDPRDTVVDLFVGDRWVDVSSDVYGREPMQIDYGHPDESQGLSPSNCAMTLNNRSGKYNPRNPLGPYYGKIGRNTPVRVRVRTIRDQFGRVSVNSWGSAPDGYPWTNTGNGSPAASEFQVTGAVATHSVPAAATYRRSYLATTSYRNVDVRVTLTSVGFTDVLGGPLEPANLIIRGHESPSTDYFLARVTIEADQSVKIGILWVGGAIYLAAPITVPGLTYAGQPLGVALQTENESIRAKVWDVNAGEPLAWQVSTSGNLGSDFKVGYVGIRSGVASANTNTLPVVFSYDNFEVSSPRFFGEIGTWNLHWNDATTDAVTVAEAAGITRRLSQGSPALDSAMKRQMLRENLVAYWPLDDGSLTEGGRAIVGGEPMRISGDTDATKQWAQGEFAPWLPNGVARLGVSELSVGGLAQPGFTGFWSVLWLMAGGRAHNDLIITTGSPSLAGTNQTWIVDFSTSADSVQITDSGGGVSTATVPALFDGSLHHMELAVTDLGGTLSFGLWVDGLNVISNSFSAGPLQPIRSLRYRNLVDPGSERLTIGHVAISSVNTSRSLMISASRGWAGETAADRVSRLCSEQGIRFSYMGDKAYVGVGAPIVANTMGAQYPDPFMTVLEECVFAEQGECYENRGDFGLEFRTIRFIWDQLPTLTLNYAADHLAPPLEPVDDDEQTRNRVTATRRNGGSYIAELTTGPLSTAPAGAGGIGAYETSVTVNTQTDTQASHIAGWVLHLGTFDGARYPKVTVSLGRSPLSNDQVLAGAALSVSIGDRIVIDNAGAISVYDQITLIVRGISETIDAFEHILTFLCTPETPYHVRNWDGATFRYDSNDSTLNSSLSSSATTFQVAFTKLGWTTDAGQFPMDVRIGGERIRISGISGTTSPQTFTVAGGGRAINGVVAGHAAGDAVTLNDPSFWG